MLSDKQEEAYQRLAEQNNSLRNGFEANKDGHGHQRKKHRKHPIVLRFEREHIRSQKFYQTVKDLIKWRQ